MQIETNIKTMLTLIFAAGLFFSTVVTGTELNTVSAAEIEQLLNRLALSGCRFQRNESWYTATDAQTHLERKYRFLRDKQLVGSAEDFVSAGATKSSMTGKPYLVQCGTQRPMLSADWMATQLYEVRRSTGRDAAAKAR